MRFLREASIEEFIRCYLSRERRKLGLENNLGEISDFALEREMRRFHANKLRGWFRFARWSMVEFDEPEELMTLICVDASFTRRDRLMAGKAPDFRIMGRVVAAALEVGHFAELEEASRISLEAYFKHERMERFRRGLPLLKDAERIALCTPNEEERTQNPSGTWYLHDGFGRLLPWLYLVSLEGYAFTPVQAFLIEDR
jgi:hypothetical protein